MDTMLTWLSIYIWGMIAGLVVARAIHRRERLKTLHVSAIVNWVEGRATLTAAHSESAALSMLWLNAIRIHKADNITEKSAPTKDECLASLTRKGLSLHSVALPVMYTGDTQYTSAEIQRYEAPDES